MDGFVQRFHCRYRVLGDGAGAARLARRLDEAVRPRLAAALEDCLDRALAGDPSVYVMRRVRARLALALAADVHDDALAGEWGERLAGSVVRRLASDPDDGDNLVRFDDQADYVASFVVDLLGGCAWERWYYLGFKSLRPRSRDQTLLTVLLDNRDELPRILGRLERRGALVSLLSALPPEALADLWLRGLAGRPVESGVGLRPLFAAALDLVARLGLPPMAGARAAALFLDYRQHASEGRDDWSSPETLARGVARAFAFLIERGAVDPAAIPFTADVIGRAVAPLEWLDRSTLAAALKRLAEPSAPLPSPRPPRRGATPRHRELLIDLARAASAIASRLDPRVPEAPANALALAAALFERSERWRGDPAVIGLIEALLRAWAALDSAVAGRNAWERLARGEVDSFLAAAGAAEPAARSALRPLTALGPEATAALLALAGGPPGRGAAGTPRAGAGAKEPERGPEDTTGALTTPAAGIFLLLRAIGDLGLPALFDNVLDPPSPVGAGAAGVLAVGLRLAGDCWPGGEGPIDRSLALFAGLDRPPDRSGLAASFAAMAVADHRTFQARLLEVATGQRLAGVSALRLFSLPAGEATLLVAEIGSGGLWPLGKVLAPGEDPRPVIGAWLAALGTLPEETSADAPLIDALSAVAVDDGRPAWRAVEPAAENASRADEHSKARERLDAALSSLDAGRLAPGRACDADLTVALAATVVLRAWARWLGRFADSSLPYLLDNLVRRPGSLHETDDGLRVELESRPLDMVLEMAGYLAPIDPPFGRGVTFSRRSPR